MRTSNHDQRKTLTLDLSRRFWVCLVLTLPVTILSESVQGWLGFNVEVPAAKYISLILSTVVFFYGGLPFLLGMFSEIKKLAPGMMTLVSLAISVAYGFSVMVVFGFHGELLFWELVTLVDIMLLGRWVEMKSLSGVSRAIENLVGLMPTEAQLVFNGQVTQIRVEDLAPGDVVVVRPGDRVPADGVVEMGESQIDERLLTGESLPVMKNSGDRVIAGSINGMGSLQVRVRRGGKETYLSRVLSLINSVQHTSSRSQSIADQAAKILTFVAIIVGALTLYVWLSLGYSPGFSVERMVAVMVISCPHALGLAVPLVMSVSISLSAQRGILIRNRRAFEDSKKISSIVFDKKGTLTDGRFKVTRFKSLVSEMNDTDILALAAATEQISEHPIAIAILQKAKELSLDLPEAKKIQNLPGQGVEAFINLKVVMVASSGYLKTQEIIIPMDISQSETLAYVLSNNSLVGYVALADKIRPQAAEAVRWFRDHGIKVYMATGDNETVAQTVAHALGIENYMAELLPQERVDLVVKLQSQGEFVAMTGDGVNDAEALAVADVGIAVGSGTDAVSETADIVLVNSNPKDVAKLVENGKKSYSKMRQNIFWATIYNVLAIPLAAGVLYWAGFVLNPAAGAVLMTLSTIIVTLNTQLLRTQINN